ncbi:MAG: helix-turn-helix domain-containing protein [Rhodospirillales bacterium]|nr:helix-turn-helix domain-containing protein [Rhodospirillales bacterium]
MKAELRILFGSTKAAAAAWGVDPSLIAQVLRRPLASIPVERRIAAALGVPPQTIWPGRWSADGNPLPRSGPKAATRKPAIPSQNREAA